MEADFWHQKWDKNEIGFHGKIANPLLIKHFPKLQLDAGARIFVPLCGKTLDIHWLLKSGYRVVGVELSKVAIEQLFSELNFEPTITHCESFERYSADNLDVFVGDIFSLTRDLLGPVDAIYDRAALVALPTNLRIRYAAHLIEVTAGSPQLLICFEYDQTLMEGPPFSIRGEELINHYGSKYNVIRIDQVDILGGLKGKLSALEDVWILNRLA